MSIEKPNWESKKSKITPMQLNMAAHTILEGADNMLAAFDSIYKQDEKALKRNIRVGIDEEGNYTEYSIKKMMPYLISEIEYAEDDVLKRKYQKMLEFLEQYLNQK